MAHPTWEMKMRGEDVLYQGFLACLAVMGAFVGIGFGAQVAAIAGMDTGDLATRAMIAVAAMPAGLLFPKLVRRALQRQAVR